MNGLFLAAATLLSLALLNSASAQDIMVQVDLGGQGCSILQIDAAGTLLELASTADILSVTGESACVLDDTGLVVNEEGVVYFTETFSDDVLQIAPDGNISVLVPSETLDALISDSTANPGSGLDIGPDGNLYMSDQFCNCIFQITPQGAASIFVDNADIVAASAGTEHDLEGGLAFGTDGTLYFVDNENVLLANSGGEVSLLTTQAEILTILPDNATEADLDVDIAFGNGILYVLIDGQYSALVAINPSTGQPSLVVDGDEVIAALDINAEGNIDPEGGLGFDPSTGSFVFAIDNWDESIGDAQSVLGRATPSGDISLVLGDAELRAFYEALYGPMNNYRFRGGLDISGGDQPAPQSVPALTPLALVFLALMLLGIGMLARPRL